MNLQKQVFVSPGFCRKLFNLINKLFIGGIFSFCLHSNMEEKVSYPRFKTYGLELDEGTRTIRYNNAGEPFTLSLAQVKKGKRLFLAACGTCHVGGLTKPNPNLNLDLKTLSLAIPPRDNIRSLVNFMIAPKTYDNRTSIAEIHPNIECADLWTKMRTFSERDLIDIAGHILLQPKILGEKWGGGKIYY